VKTAQTCSEDCGRHLLVAGSPALARATPGARWKAYAAGLQAARPHRLLAPAQQSFHSAMVEPIFYNRSVRTNGGGYFTPSTLPELSRLGLQRLRDVRQYLQGLGPTAPHRAVRILLGGLPDSWRQHVERPDNPPPDWTCSSDQAWVCREGQVACYARVQPDGSFRLDPSIMPPGQVQWAPCCVFGAESIVASVQNGQPSLRRPSVCYLVGPWDELDCDPSVWGLGKQLIADYVVKNASLRILHARMMQSGIESGGHRHFMGTPVFPQLWRGLSSPAAAGAPSSSGQGPLPADVRLVSRLSQGGATAQRRSRGEYEQVDYRPPSLLPASPRPAPGQRDATRRLPPPADQSDSLSPLIGEAQPWWQGVWSRLVGARLPRDVYVFAWRLLHGALFCGGYFLLTAGLTSNSVDGHCAAEGCSGVVESWGHMLHSCPVVQPAVQWFEQFWEAVSGEQVAMTPMVLVAGFPGAYAPAQELADLWLRTRLLFLHSVWVLRCKRAVQGVSFTASQIGALFVGRLRRCIKSDFVRASTDLPEASGVCRLWFGGEPGGRFDYAEFEARWCHGGKLASVGSAGSGARRVLSLHVCASAPVPIPPSGSSQSSSPLSALSV